MTDDGAPPAPDDQTSWRHQRWRALRSAPAAAVAGIVFGVLISVAAWLVSDQPGPREPNDALLEWLEDPASSERMVQAQTATFFAIIAFLWFIGVFRRRVEHRADEFTGSVFLGSGLVLAALTVVAVALLTSPTIAIDGTPTPEDAVAVQAASAVGIDLITIFASGLAGVFTLNSAVIMLRSGAFPRWSAVVGFLVALALFISPYRLLDGFALFPIWIMFISLIVLTHRRELTSNPGPN